MSKRYSGKSFKDSSVKKNQNLHLKKRGNLKEKSQKSLTNLNKYQLIKPVMHFFNVFKSI